MDGHQAKAPGVTGFYPSAFFCTSTPKPPLRCCVAPVTVGGWGNLERYAVTAQEQFDETYITSSEICKELNITRSTIVTGRRRGLLPKPIVVNGAQIQIWHRAEVRPYLDAWKGKLEARRGVCPA